ncbi:MAG: hypothetical protein ACREDK_01860 [Thermoplasmata archaeon]
MPADDADLEVHLLQFRLKSFDFERSVRVGERDYAIFQRTETESESQFRPRLVRLRVILPRAWIVYDLASDELFIARDGVTPGSRSTGTAVEEGAETTEFTEQGVDWRKVTLARGTVVYVPRDEAVSLLAPAGRSALGLG